MLIRVTFRQSLLGLLLSLAISCHAKPGEPIAVEARPDPDKAWRSYPTRTIDQLENYNPPKQLPKLNKYGGLADDKFEVTGFFHTKKIDGRWWLIDPDGCRFLHVGVASVRLGESQRSRESFKKKFGTDGNWAAETNNLLRTNSFTGTGAWSHNEPLQSASGKVPYTMIWSFMRNYLKVRPEKYRTSGTLGFPNKCFVVFDPEFKSFCEEHAKQLMPTVKDPWLLGHFSDNELPFDHRSLGRYLALPANDPGRAAAREWLEKYRGKKLADDASTTVTSKESRRFLEFAVGRYYEIVSRVIRKNDPNHLYLGCRWNSVAVRLAEIYSAARPYVDVNSINYYNAWTPRPERMALWAGESDKPAIVSEFYVKGADSGLANNSGAGWEVKTQADRGRFYQNYVLGLIESKTVVGWHWFRYMDNDPAGPPRGGVKEDSNKGIVTVGHEPHKDLLKAMRELNSQVYNLVEYFDSRKNSSGSDGNNEGIN